MLISVNALALTTLSLLALGYLVLGVLALVPATSRTAREAFPILFTETAIIGVGVGAIWVGGYATAALLLLLVARVVWEAATVGALRAQILPPLALAGAAVLACLLLSLLPTQGAALACVCALLGCLAARIYATAPRVQVYLDLAIFPGMPLLLFASAGIGGAYAGWLLLAFMLVETFDSYALLGGKLFGRTKAFPVLSPRKTVEGLMAGSAMLIATAAAAALLFGVTVSSAVGVALVVAPLAVAGDLSASRLKRLSEVKDYPAVMPHQGGLFDIADAWISTGAGFVLIAALFGIA